MKIQSVAAVLCSTALALLIGYDTASAQIGDSRCVTKAFDFAFKVDKQQNKAAYKCIKKEGAGKLTTPVETCLTADDKGKVQDAKDKLSKLFDAGEACDGQAGTDLVTGSATAGTAFQNGPLDLLHDIFGPDLDAGQLAQTKPDRNCQAKVSKRAIQMFDEWLKTFRLCMKREVHDGAATTGAVVAACLAGSGQNGTGSTLLDPRDKIGKRGTKLDTTVTNQCSNQGVDLATAFPGVCAGGGVQGDVTQCLQDLAECRACKTAKQADALLSVSCDVVDNGVLDDSCPELVNADVCDPLNNAECFLPYPSSRFLVADASTATGLRVNLPAVGMPHVNGSPWLPTAMNELDGFSPMTQILMHFPQGVDLEQSDAPRLLAPGCCGQPSGPPWIDTRTYDSRSLDSDSPSVLINADTGEHILHFLELDGRATGSNIPGRQALFLRPGKSLEPGTRYIVAIRHLKAPNGDDIVAEPAFAALRDGTPTGIPSIEARRAQMESDVFTPLTNYGIDRSELQLAFDFTTQSNDQLTRQMLSMRDQAFTWLDTVNSTPGLVTFSVAATIPVSDCTHPTDVVWKKVSGTFESPLFLDGLPVQTGVQFLNVDANDLPVQNGFMDAPFDVSIPCSVFNGSIVSHPIVLGHGIFGTGQEMTDSIPDQKARYADWTYIAGATDWLGLSSRRDDSSDLNWIGLNIVGIGTSQFNNFPAFTDRLRQGMLNTLVLGKMMKLGLFNRDPAFEKSPGVGVFPGPSEEMYYYGISLGGIHGTWFSALTPDVDRFGLDVPAINFSCLLQRSTQFSTFDIAIQSIGVTDPMQFALLIDLVHELWVSAEPAGYATHITSDPLPGSGSAKHILYMEGWLDKQVSNQCTEAAARTMQLPNLVGSLQEDLQDIPDLAGPLDSAYVIYDTGAFDLFNPAHQPFIPPLSNIIPSGVCDPHNMPRNTPAAIRQLINFLQPGGQVSNFCNGLCDAGEPLEIQNGGTCDASSPPLLQGAPCAGDGDCGGGTCVATICDPLNP
jgi:hypothetical protein